MHQIGMLERSLAGSYERRNCESRLTSPLIEAGQTFDCPACGVKIQTPAIEELKRHRIAKEKQRIETAKLEEAKRALNEIAKARIRAELNAEAAREHRAFTPASKWRICGVWRDTGERVELLIDSTTATSAEAIASNRGITVSSSEPVLPIPTALNGGIPLNEGWFGRPNKNDIICPNPN